MLQTSSRLHTFTYAVLLAVVLICLSVHLGAFVADNVTASGSSLILVSAIVSGVLAPPASILLAVYSHRMIKVQERLHDLAITDPLTGLSNRRAFSAGYEKEMARFGRTGQRMSILLLDIDHFKYVNSVHGHAGGDASLVALAEVLKQSIRFGTDEVSRWGGEEFVILLTNTGRQSAIRAALRFRQSIENLNVNFVDKSITLTASIGVIECRADEDLEAAIVRADKCLREAKRRGRNKVVAFPAPVEDLQVAEAG